MQETPKSLIWLRFTAEPRTGRFITRDSYRGERENADTWHLYAYCANNPINYVDPSGHFAIAIPWIFAEIGFSTVLSNLAAGIASIVVSSVIGITYTKARRAVSIKNKDKSNISSFVGTLASSINKSWKHKRNSKRPVHHIIAQTAGKAKLAGNIWVDNHNIDINSSKNLVKLKQNFHKHLHTNKYYYGVNSIVSTSQYMVEGIRREFPRLLSKSKANSIKKRTCKLSVAVIKKVLQAASLASKS